MFLLQHENPERWHQMLADFRDEFQPASPFEDRLVEEIAFCYWRMQRAWVTETSLLDGEMDKGAAEFAANYEHADEGVRQGAAFGRSRTQASRCRSISATKPALSAPTSGPSRPWKSAVPSEPPVTPLLIFPAVNIRKYFSRYLSASGTCLCR